MWIKPFTAFSWIWQIQIYQSAVCWGRPRIVTRHYIIPCGFFARKQSCNQKPPLSSAVAVTWRNNRASSLLRILKRLHIEPGLQTELYVKQADKKRLKKAEIREKQLGRVFKGISNNSKLDMGSLYLLTSNGWPNPVL